MGPGSLWALTPLLALLAAIREDPGCGDHFQRAGLKGGCCPRPAPYGELRGGGQRSRGARQLLCLLSCPAGPRHAVPHLGAAPSRCPAPAQGAVRVPAPRALEGGEGWLCPPAQAARVPLCVDVCCIFPAFCAPLPDSFPSSWAMLGPQPGPPDPAGAPAWALHLCTAAASSPAPALLIHTLSLSVPAPSLCLSLSLSFSFSPLLTGFWVCNF